MHCMFAWWNYLLEVEKTSVSFIVHHRSGVLCARHRLSRSSVDKTVLSRAFNATQQSIHIYSDNTGMIALSNNPVLHNRSQHMISGAFRQGPYPLKNHLHSHIPELKWCRLPHWRLSASPTWVLLRAFGHEQMIEIERSVEIFMSNSNLIIYFSHNSTFSVRTRHRGYRVHWVQMSASARALCLPTNSVQVFRGWSNLQISGCKSNTSLCSGDIRWS